MSRKFVGIDQQETSDPTVISTETTTEGVRIVASNNRTRVVVGTIDHDGTMDLWHISDVNAHSLGINLSKCKIHLDD